MVLYTCVYYLTLFFAPLIGYLLLLKRQSSPDWYYPIRYYFAKNKVHPKKIDDATEKECEYHLIKAIDQNCNYLILKLTLKKHRLVESTIVLQLNKKIYQLPNAPEVTVSSTGTTNEFKAAGLEIQTLEAERRLRVLYNGLLVDKDGNLQHFRFNLIWTCAGKPFFHPEDASVALFADALAREKWRDGNWLQLLPQESYTEQYGALKGRITQETTTIDVNFASYRKYAQMNVEINRELTFFAAAEDGTVFNLGVKSYGAGVCSQVKYGSLITNNGEVFGLDGHDLNLFQVDNFPSVFVLHLKADDETFKCAMHLDISKSTKEYCTEEDGWEIVRIPFECDLNALQAKGIFTAWVQSKGIGKENPPPVLVDFNKPTCLIHFIKPLHDDYSKNLRFSGGKANSLALLNSLDANEYKIPPGIVVFVAAFRFQITKNNEIAEALQELENKTDQDLEEACRRTMKIISKTEIHDSIQKNLTKELENIYNKFSGDGEWSWAVRSSAIGEDSSDLSAAGQNATYLGCKTEKDILESLAKCWASPYSYKSVQYRKQHGLPIRCDLAVLVQKMVNAESAGVIFTCEPATGNPLYMVVTSNYGLGESVVSGTAEPDTIVLKRDYKTNKLNVHSQQVGKKNVRIVMKGEDIASESVAENDANVLSLTEKQVLQLGLAAWNIEKSFGYPLDIEWAFENNDLFILQARPVTTLNSWTEYELSHEFDSAILSEEDTFLTKANIGEVMPGALSVLSRSTTASWVALAMEKCAQIHLNRYKDRAFSYQHHHAFIEFTNMFSKTYGQDEDTLTNQAVDLSVFGHLVRTEEIASVVVRRYKKSANGSKWKKFKYLLDTLKVVWSADDCLKKAINTNKNVDVNIEKEDNSARAHEKIEKYLEETFFDLALCHSISSSTSVFYQFVAMSILTRDQAILTPDHYHDISLLFSCDEDVVSVEIPKRLQQLASAITDAGLSDNFLAIPSENGLQFLQKHSLKIYNEFCVFLQEQGHRSLREFELQANTFGSEPKQLIEFIKHHIKTANFTKTSNSVTVAETAEKLKTPKDKTTRKLLKFVMGKSRKAVARREATKSELIRAVDKLRKSYQTLAQILKNEGKIPSVDLIYHLSHNEIGDLIGNQSNAPILVKKSVLRRRLYPKWDALKFLEISRGIPVPLQDNTKSDKETVKEVKGTPVCMGEIEGRACVINNIEEANQIQQGDILITYCTDTAWSLYFPMLSGIVTELGGLISHGAVVAREFCLPCIVGTGNATKMFKTGDIVHLSGTKGVLRLIK